MLLSDTREPNSFHLISAGCANAQYVAPCSITPQIVILDGIVPLILLALQPDSSPLTPYDRPAAARDAGLRCRISTTDHAETCGLPLFSRPLSFE